MNCANAVGCGGFDTTEAGSGTKSRRTVKREKLRAICSDGAKARLQTVFLSQRKLEAPPGFEPGIEVLQTVQRRADAE